MPLRPTLILSLLFIVGCQDEPNLIDTPNDMGQKEDAISKKDMTPNDAIPGEDAFTKDAAISDSGRDMSSLGTMQAIAQGREQGCYVLQSKLYCWGNNSSAEVGDGTTIERLTPVFILDDVVTVSAGFGNSCAIKRDETVWCWGSNEAGELGTGDGENSTTPVQVLTGVGGAPLTEVIDIATADFHSCVARKNGEVYCWGPGEESQVGLPLQGIAYARKIEGVSGATQVGAKFEFSCALTNGKVMCWGGGGWSGAVGPNFDEANAHIPVEVPLPVRATSILLSEETACAVGEDSQLYCWGGNTYSELGVQPGSDDNPATKVPGLNKIVGGDGGVAHLCVFDESGDVFCWGNNTFSDEGGPDTINGKVGNDRNKIQNTPEKVAGIPGKVSAIAVGDQTSCVIVEANQVYCWGNNGEGQFGNGEKNTTTATPTMTSAPSL